MNEDKQIYGLMSKVMEDIGAIPKDSTNDYFKFKYRGIDAVYKALHQAFLKNGVICTPEIVDSEGHEVMRTTKTGDKPHWHAIVTVRYTFWAPDGSNVSCSVRAGAMDTGDKSENKAMTAAFKWAMFQTFSIPVEGMPDADGEDTGYSPPKTAEHAKEPAFDLDAAKRKFMAKVKAYRADSTSTMNDGGFIKAIIKSQLEKETIDTKEELDKVDGMLSASAFDPNNGEEFPF